MSFLTNASQAMPEVNVEVAEVISDLLVKDLGYSPEVADFWSKSLARKDGAMQVYVNDMALKMGIVYYNNAIFNAQAKVIDITNDYAEFLLSYMEKNPNGSNIDLNLKEIAYMLTSNQIKHLKSCIESGIRTQCMNDHRHSLVTYLDKRLNAIQENSQASDECECLNTVQENTQAGD